MEDTVRTVENAVCQSGSERPSPQPFAAAVATGVHGSTLCYMLHRLLDFREVEVQSVAEMYGVSKEQLNLRFLPDDHPYSPFRLVDLPSDDVARKVIRRTHLTKGLYEVWGVGDDMEQLKASIAACPRSVIDPWTGPETSFKFVVEGFGRKLAMPQQLRLMNDLEPVLQFDGEVDLKNPDLKVVIIACDCSSNLGLPREIRKRYIVGREIETRGTKGDLQTFTLKGRRYLGPTSMDAELSFVMCNLAHISPRDLVLDPFAGTGSILVSAAAMGATVIGGDIDVRAIRDGKLDKQGQRVNVYTNFRDYKLPDPAGLLRIDAHNPPWRTGASGSGFLDAILCDPPYGVRAGGRKMAPAVAVVSAEEAAQRAQPHFIPSTAPYGLGECLRDLLETAARLLVLNGRLCYWMPDFADLGSIVGADGDSVASSSSPAMANTLDMGNDALGSIHRDVMEASKLSAIAEHPCLRVVNNSVQGLSSRYMRRMITMVKHTEYDKAKVAAWQATLGDPIMAIDDLHDIVYEPRETENGKPAKKRFRGKTQ